MLLLTDPTGGKELYLLAHEGRSESGGIITNLFSIIYNVFSDIGILLYFYYLAFIPKKRILSIGFIVAIILGLLLPISKGLRTGVTMKIFTILCAYITMKRFIPIEKRKIINRVGGICLGIVIFLMTVLTLSRFGNRYEGPLTYVVNYVGQGNLHFDTKALDAGGIRYGDRTANTFKRLLMFDDVPNSIMDVRSKYSHLKMDDSIFYTFVGDFVLDYGPILTILLFTVFSMITSKITKIKKNRLYFHQLIILFMVMCICTQGSFYLFNYSFTGNLCIIAFALTYVIFWYDSTQHLNIKSTE